MTVRSFRGRRLVAIGIMAVLSSVLFLPSASAATATISSTVGQIVDPGAVAGGFYLRDVGNPAPAGFSHNYQWGSQVVRTPSPEAGPVTLSGSIDLTTRGLGSTTLIGLLDATALESGSDSFQRGAYIYINARVDGTVRIGLSDGNAAGEIVQTSHNLSAATADAGPITVTFTVDGTADPATCAVGPSVDADGCLTLQVNDLTPKSDSYGSITDPSGPAVEFADGAFTGWEVIPAGSGNVGYSLDVSPVEPPPVINPVTREDCKNGGWETYGFSNQGQCIRFVNTGQDSRL